MRWNSVAGQSGSDRGRGHPLFSFWNTTQYRLTGAAYPPDSPPITNQVVKSAFELRFGAAFPAGVRQVLTGRSWSGLRPVKRVDISADGSDVEAGAPPRAESQERLGALEDRLDTAGRRYLRAAAGQTQPDSVPFNDLGYLFGAVVRHPVVAT